MIKKERKISQLKGERKLLNKKNAKVGAINSAAYAAISVCNQSWSVQLKITKKNIKIKSEKEIYE